MDGRYGCSTVVLICFTCPVDNVAAVVSVVPEIAESVVFPGCFTMIHVRKNGRLTWLELTDNARSLQGFVHAG